MAKTIFTQLHELSMLPTTGFEDYRILQGAMLETEEGKDIVECINQYNEGLVSFIELINVIVYKAVICTTEQKEKDMNHDTM